MLADPGLGCPRIACDLLIRQVLRVFDERRERAGRLGPVKSGLLPYLTVEPHIVEQVQLRTSECFEQARIGAAHLVSVDVGEGIFPDLHQEFSVVNGSREDDPGVRLKVKLILQRLHELFVFRRDDRKLLRGSGRHEFAQHDLEIVLRHKAADDEEVLSRLESPLPEPGLKGRVAVRKR